MPPYSPPWFLRNGYLMTIYIAQVAGQTWQNTLKVPPVAYQSHVFEGYEGVPIFGQWACPKKRTRHHHCHLWHYRQSRRPVDTRNFEPQGP